MQTSHPTDQTDARREMARRQLAGRDIEDPSILEAIAEVPREAFVPEPLREFAYEDSALPIEAGQTISQPYIVAKMAALAGLSRDDIVLEVGAGSGYAAAVFARLCRHVYAVERLQVLSDHARRILAELHIDNVEIIHGDGAEGLPGHAPFDAIVISAGAAEIPAALCEQLSIGGRIVAPLAANGAQVLARIRRTADDAYEREDFGLVQFVPLVSGERSETLDIENVAEHEPHARETGRLYPKAPKGDDLSSLIAEIAEPFSDLEELGRLAERFADRRVVLLGEATHGTAEFYNARARITERLVGKHGFNIVAVEADWPDAAAYNRFCRGVSRSETAEEPFTRFPSWMWRNAQGYDFVERLRAMNETKTTPEETVGFYGLDIYSMCASCDAVLDYLREVDAAAAQAAAARYACLTPWCSDPAEYGAMAQTAHFGECEDAVAEVLTDLLKKRLDYLTRDGDLFSFDAEQNARIVAEAERYYRVMYYGSAESWNLRDRHMFDTLERLLDHRGPESKAVVWAHNSHIGDARHTEMNWFRGEHNLGQLVRESYGDAAALIGFGTDRGTVAAASRWGGPTEVKDVRPALDASFEGRCRKSGVPAFLLDVDGRREALEETMLERAIGVVYRPETERASHYFEARPGAQFDAWIWFEKTSAVDSEAVFSSEGPQETYPFGV